jgi:hypothetical protein
VPQACSSKNLTQKEFITSSIKHREKEKAMFRASTANFTTSRPALSVAIITRIGPVLTTTTTFLSYQWYRNGTAITGATNQNYTMMANGSYSIKVTDSNGCGANSNTIVANVGIESFPISNAGVNFYPNPANEQIWLENAVGGIVAIHNIIGEKILSANVNDKKQVLNIASLLPGVYTLRAIMDDGSIWTQRLIKEKQ